MFRGAYRRELRDRVRTCVRSYPYGYRRACRGEGLGESGNDRLAYRERLCAWGQLEAIASV